MTRGGALAFIDSRVTIDHTNFFDNTACTGGAVFTMRGMVSLLNVNFMQNRAFSTGSGVIKGNRKLCVHKQQQFHFQYSTKGGNFERNHV